MPVARPYNVAPRLALSLASSSGASLVRLSRIVEKQVIVTNLPNVKNT